MVHLKRSSVSHDYSWFNHGRPEHPGYLKKTCLPARTQMPDDSQSINDSAQTIDFVDVRIYPIDLEFLLPFLRQRAHFVANPEDADFILSMNSVSSDAIETLTRAKRWGKPIAWWTVEDPNWFEAFIEQAAHADFVFTTDEVCVPQYRHRLGHDRVFWLPLACSPELHHSLMLDG